MADSGGPSALDSWRDSQAVSLHHIDPAPIESPATERDDLTLPDDVIDDEENYTPKDRRSGTAAAPGLSGTGRGAIYYLTRIQKYSSYAMSLFTTLHISNVSLIPAATGSVDASETYLLMTREIYQTSIAEPLLVILPVVAHVGSGVALRLLRRAQNVRRYGDRGLWTGRGSHGNTTSPWPEMSFISISGYAFMIFYSGHVLMNRLLPLAVEGDSSNVGLAYIAHGFARHPFVSWFSYIGLIGVGAGHMVWGTARWLGLAPSTRGWLKPRNKTVSVVVDRKTRRQRRRRWLGVQGMTVLVAALWAVGGLGVVARGGPTSGWLGALYDNLYAKAGL
ncbi:unnamed protein product [Clonostachys rosea]|uniref:Mitochondrial adapter protein MCP1 transmembrane domain-containing protein n=1 Tax=Bionectria ochroleuca TaxID=29856 RepID=A0ABY6UTY7_BIOOC|nr:unnamed protein product [Clonostachys rosea]